MFNKNLIVGLVVVVLIGGGIAFYFLNGNKTTTTLTPIARKGELTRPLATKILWDFYNSHPENNNDTATFTYNNTLKGYNFFLYGEAEIQPLIDKGLIKKVNQNIFDFTDAAAPYLTDGATAGTKIVKLGDWKVKNITVTGITKQTETTAIVNVDIDGESTFTPFGEVLSSHKAQQTNSAPIPFNLYDDGWRINPALTQ